MNFYDYVRLTWDEVQLVTAADADNKPTSKRTRLYTIVRNRRKNDIAFVKVAVRHIRGVRRIKPVAVTSVDSRMTAYTGECDIISSLGPAPVTLKVGWREADLKTNGEQKDYASYSRMWWYTCKSEAQSWHTKDRTGKRDATRYWLWYDMPLNWDETIAANPRFRYCAFSRGCSPLDWLRRYCVAPEIETFAKLGITWLASVPFVMKLRRDKGLFRFVRDNIDQIKSFGWRRAGQTAVCHAYNHGLTLAEELEHRDKIKRVSQFKRYMTGFTKDGLPRKFDYLAAVNYIGRTRISDWEYCRYLDYCIEGGADLTAPQTAFPRDIERRLADFDKAAEIRRKREERARKRKAAEERKEREVALHELAETYARLCKRLKTSGYTIVFPTSAQDFVREGRAMNNCIGGGGYTIRHADRQCVCVFIRLADKPDTPFVDVEIVKGKVVQCYAKGNQNTDKSVRKIADKVAKAIYRKAA